MVLTGTVNVVTTVVAVVVIERVGRRKLILIPCLIIAAIYLLLTVCLTVKVDNVLPFTFCLGFLCIRKIRPTRFAGPSWVSA